MPDAYTIVANSTDPVIASSLLQLSGAATCDACPPSETAFGGCPVIQPGPPTAIEVQWQNLTTGASGSALHGIAGQCSCLFSYCTVTYAHHWTASVPLAIGPNEIVVAALGPEREAGTDTVLVTRVPHTPAGVVATAEHGAITLAWPPVSDAERYDLLASTSSDLANAQRIADVTSPFRHEGLADDVTHWYALVAVASGYDSAASDVVWATTGWSVEPLPAAQASWSPSAIAIAVGPADSLHVLTSRREALEFPLWTQHDEYLTDSGGAWTATATSGSQFGDANVAVDGAGVVHLGWDGAGLVHATITAGVWSTETVPPLGGCRSGLALDASGHAHVVGKSDLWNGTAWSSTLRTATNASGAWSASIVDASDLGCGFPGVAPRIAVSSSGVEFVAYQGAAPAYGLRCASNTGGTWSSTPLANGSVRGIALALDPQGEPHVLYSDASAELHHAWRASGAWSDERVDAVQAVAPSVAVDDDGHVHASYVVANGELRYATNANGTWHVARVASDVRASDDRTTALALDSRGRVHVATFGALAPIHVTNR